MKHFSVLKISLTLVMVAVVGGAISFIEKNSQSFENFLGIADAPTMNQISAPYDNRLTDEARQSTGAGSTYRSPITSPTASSTGTRFRQTEGSTLHHMPDAIGFDSDWNYTSKRARENVSGHSDMSMMIASSAMRSSSQSENITVMPESTPFSTNTPSFAPSATSAGGDPGTDPTGPPLPVGSGIVVLAALAFGYGVIKRLKS